MKLCLTVFAAVFGCAVAGAGTHTYVGSTPAHAVIRDFLQISQTDSIDFIRWKLEMGSGTFKLHCRYGLAKPGTPGFSNEQPAAFEGQLTKTNHYYILRSKDRRISLLEVNVNILHFLDQHKQMLTGNGGYSYALNNTRPADTDGFNIRSAQSGIESPLVFEGRTPCSQLPALLGIHKSAACNKMKWYFLLYADSITAKPTYFLMRGTAYRIESMSRGSWQADTSIDGRIIYRLHFDQWARSLNLLKGDDNILFFIDDKGRLLTGNGDFSYTLNRRKNPYPPVIR